MDTAEMQTDPHTVTDATHRPIPRIGYASVRELKRHKSLVWLTAGDICALHNPLPHHWFT